MQCKVCEKLIVCLNGGRPVNKPSTCRGLVEVVYSFSVYVQCCKRLLFFFGLDDIPKATLGKLRDRMERIWAFLSQ